MAVADILSGIGKGLETAGKAAVPVLERTAQVVSGQAPQIDEERRQQQYKLEDAQIAAKEQELTAQLEMGRKYGTLTPEQQGQYVDQISQLYSHPRHAPTLMEKLRKAVHPNGAVAAPPPSLKDATPAGGTAAADQRLKGTEEDENEKTLKSLKFFDEHLATQFPPDQRAAKRNAFIDHLAGIKDPTAEKPPKGLKAMEQGGVFFGVEDQDTGKQYMKAQLEPGGDAPPDAKAMYESVKKAAADKAALTDKKEQEAEDRQNRMFAHSFEMQDRAIKKAIELGDYKEARKEVSKADEGYQASVDRASTMDKAALAAKKGDQQAMFAVLSNHIAMTLQQPQVSARPTKAMFDEAAGSLPWMQKITKQFDSDGYLSGITLSPDQIDKMVDLGHQKVDTQKDHVDRVRSEYQDDLNPQTPGGKAIKKPGGVARALTPVGRPGGTAWKAPADAPAAPREDGKVLKSNGQVIARSKGGQWVQP